MFSFVEFRPADAGLKLWRANEHVQELEAVIEAWLKLKPYRVWKEYEAETDQWVIYAEPRGQVPLQLPAIVGDILQNLRASLDHIAFALSERGYGRPLPEKLARNCHFPISDSPQKFAATRRSNILHVAAEPLAIIEAVQPYRSTHGIDGAELMVLKKLSEFDKHRALPVVIRNARITHPFDVALRKVTGEATTVHYTFVGALEGKTPMWYYPNIRGLEVNVEDGFAPEICFGDEAPPRAVGQEISTVLSHLWMFVGSEIVTPLNPYLE